MKQGSANRPARPRHARPIIRRGAKTALSVTLAAALSCMTPAAALANDEEVASPTDAEHSRLVYSFEDVYQYGGYHRASLPEDSWIAMREGQRFAVVTTQKCLDDVKWYQSAAINFANYSFLDTDGYRSKITASVQAEYLYRYWGKFYDEHIAAGDDAATAETAARTEVASKVKEEGARSRIADAVSRPSGALDYGALSLAPTKFWQMR